jgi:hypothetical protein
VRVPVGALGNSARIAAAGNLTALTGIRDVINADKQRVAAVEASRKAAPTAPHKFIIVWPHIFPKSFVALGSHSLRITSRRMIRGSPQN